MRLFLVRHGESEMNGKKIYQGQSDCNLSKLGFEQIEKIGKRLGDFEFDLIYSSPLKRAYKTANEIAKYKDQKIIVDKRLSERSHGDLTGKPYDDYYFSKNVHPVYVRPPNGEDFFDHKRRVEIFFEDIKDNIGKDVLVVSHGGTMRAFLNLFFDIDPKDLYSKKIPIGNTSLFLIEFNEEFEPKFILKNCLTHLKN